MRVIDLLSLISDYPRNTRVRFAVNDRLENYVSYDLRTVNEADQLIIRTHVEGRPIKLWEFIVLLHQKANNQRFVYVAEAENVIPVFGMQEVDGQIVVR